MYHILSKHTEDEDEVEGVGIPAGTPTAIGSVGLVMGEGEGAFTGIALGRLVNEGRRVRVVGTDV